MKPIYIIVFIINTLNLSAQTTLWQRNLPSSAQDFLANMTSTIDRQILLSGSSIKSDRQQAVGSKQNAGYDYHIVKLDQRGNPVWEKYFGGSRHDYLAASTATKEGGFLVAGTSFSNKSGDKLENNLGGSDVWILRLDENGSEIWQKTLGTKSNDEASAVVQAMDETFFVAGNINSNKELFGSKDVFVSKLDQNGNLVQTTILGGSGLDEVADMMPTTDGGAILAVYSVNSSDSKFKVQNSLASKFNVQNSRLSSDKNTNSGKVSNLLEFMSPESRIPQLETRNIVRLSTNASLRTQFIEASNPEPFDFAQGDNGDYLIVKLDKNAEIEWQKTFGGTGDDRPKKISLAENGYIISGESRSNSSGNKTQNIEDGTDVWVIYLDKNGDEIWQKNYNFGGRDVAMSLSVINGRGESHSPNESNIKGILIGGYTQAEEKIKKDDEKFWMLCIDSEGKEMWRKFVEGNEKKREERLVSARLQGDGTYLLAGTSADELGEEHWKILKLGDSDLENMIDNQPLAVYPNPVGDYCYVELRDTSFEVRDVEEFSIEIYDMSGKKLQAVKTKNAVTKIDTSALPQGVYIVTANMKSTKIVKK
ncbi:MAG: T9SS type A sorting domain-containing protein [Flavobacteriaceae bacterium]|jgi:hypothetical protein|nr:T9SS type A sorting domain-containing protein [Flavobacteriaceae bacterium]